MIAKYNTSGTIQWQRSLGSTAESSGLHIAINSLGDIYVSGFTEVSGPRSFLFAKLPSDGSRTGTYTVGGYSFTYAASTLTDAAGTLSSLSLSLTDSTPSLTTTASTLTDAASTFTSTVTSI